MNVTEAITPQIFDDFNDVKLRYEVSDEDFSKAVRFALAFTSNTSRQDAFREVFPEMVKKNIGRESAYYLKRSYVNSLITRMYATNNLMYSDKRNMVIEEMCLVAMEDGEAVGYRNKIDAAKVFLENTRMPESLVIDHKFDIDDSSKKAMDAFMGTMEAISQGKIGMMNKEGEIIDVLEIE